MPSLNQIELPDGLNESEVQAIRLKSGRNIFFTERPRRLPVIVGDIVREPMFILLVVSCSLYFILGELQEGIMMLTAILIVTAISLYQEARSSAALEALREYAEPRVWVRRAGAEREVSSEDIVPGDIVLLEEGNKVPADGIVIQANDLTVNESILTGESFPVEKLREAGKDRLYQGTYINSGKCYARVTETGNNTELGKIGLSLKSLPSVQTPLQKQINAFVRKLAYFGFAGFFVVWLINYLNSNLFVESLLLGLTIAMSAIPEEVPVAFTSFMALGAYYMARRGMISRQPMTVENMGAVTVICLDKTGTITRNQMEVKNIYDYAHDRLMEADKTSVQTYVLDYAFLASEARPFDSMEKAIATAYEKKTDRKFDTKNIDMVHEYPLEGRPPMMTHVYACGNEKVIAAKGAIERIMQVCRLSPSVVTHVSKLAKELALKGYRVLGVARAQHWNGELPKEQDAFHWQFEGFLALYDPPKENVATVLQAFNKAGIAVKLLTGDYPETAMSIASQVGMEHHDKFITGEQVIKMTQGEIKEAVKNYAVFTRMFPETKLRVIETLKANGEVTAMTGDGVNDGPALKAADIGIAMGKRGAEMARQASGLVLTDDNPAKIVEAIRHGRKIYLNLKKATRYIVSIHIPIILIASVPLLLGWKYPNLFTPIHVIFLELIMGPTCSIFYEREPEESNLMQIPPRKNGASLFGMHEMMTSIIQGVVITAGLLALDYYFIHQGYGLPYTRTIIFTTLVLSNLFLTFVNRSFTETILKTIHYKNNLTLPVAGASLLFIAVIHFVPFARDLFGLSPISFSHFLLCIATAFVSVTWFEVRKLLSLFEV